MGYDTRGSNGRGNGKLKKVGAMWRPKPGGKSCGSGSFELKGWKQRFVVLKNTRKVDGSREPDWFLMSGDEPEPNVRDQRSGDDRRDERDDDRRDDVPF